jgi:hypothetical protein
MNLKCFNVNDKEESREGGEIKGMKKKCGKDDVRR